VSPDPREIIKGQSCTSTLHRLRDISQQDKSELQHITKELEKTSTDLTTFQQRNDSLKEELAKAEETIDELKEQV